LSCTDVGGKSSSSPQIRATAASVGSAVTSAVDPRSGEAAASTCPAVRSPVAIRTTSAESARTAAAGAASVSGAAVGAGVEGGSYRAFTASDVDTTNSAPSRRAPTNPLRKSYAGWLRSVGA
jgi:hypothetical protein